MQAQHQLEEAGRQVAAPRLGSEEEGNGLVAHQTKLSRALCGRLLLEPQLPFGQAFCAQSRRCSPDFEAAQMHCPAVPKGVEERVVLQTRGQVPQCFSGDSSLLHEALGMTPPVTATPGDDEHLRLQPLQLTSTLNLVSSGVATPSA